jgi:hypothetical protein
MEMYVGYLVEIVAAYVGLYLALLLGGNFGGDYRTIWCLKLSKIGLNLEFLQLVYEEYRILLLLKNWLESRLFAACLRRK